MILKENPAPKEYDGEAEVEEDKPADAEWEEEKAKEELKVEEEAQQREHHDYCILSPCNICDDFQTKRFYRRHSGGLYVRSEPSLLMLTPPTTTAIC